MKLFCTGFLQVFLVSTNTYLISKAMIPGVFVAGFLISLVWSFNVQKVAFSGIKARMIYSLGAALGGVCGVMLTLQVI